MGKDCKLLKINVASSQLKLAPSEIQKCENHKKAVQVVHTSDLLMTLHSMGKKSEAIHKLKTFLTNLAM